MAGTALVVPLAQCCEILTEMFCDVVETEKAGIVESEVDRVRCCGRIGWSVFGRVWCGAGGKCGLSEGLGDLLGEGEDFVDPGLDDITVP